MRKTTKPIEGGHRGLQDYRHIICYYFYVFNVFYVFFSKSKKSRLFTFFAVFRTFSRTLKMPPTLLLRLPREMKLQVGVSFGARHCHIPHERPPCVPRNQHQPIWAFSVRTTKARWFLRHSDAGWGERSCYNITEMVVSCGNAWCSLTDKTVATKWVNLGTTAALVAHWWHTFVGHLPFLSRFSGTLCPRTCGIRRFLRTVTGSHWGRFYLRSTSVFSALEVFLREWAM